MKKTPKHFTILRGNRKHVWPNQEVLRVLWTQCPPLIFPPDLPSHVWTWSRATTTLAQRCTSPLQKVTLDRRAYFPKIATAALFKFEWLLALSPQVTLKLLSFWLTCAKWILTSKTGMETRGAVGPKTQQFYNILHFTVHQVGQHANRWRYAVQPRCCRFHPAKVSECVRLFVRSRGAEDCPDGKEHSLSY